MARKGFRIEKVIEKLREITVLVSQKHSVMEACRKSSDRGKRYVTDTDVISWFHQLEGGFGYGQWVFDHLQME